MSAGLSSAAKTYPEEFSPRPAKIHATSLVRLCVFPCGYPTGCAIPSVPAVYTLFLAAGQSHSCFCLRQTAFGGYGCFVRQAKKIAGYLYADADVACTSAVALLTRKVTGRTYCVGPTLLVEACRSMWTGYTFFKC